MGTDCLHIDKLITGAVGMGRLADGMIAFVPFVLPGETVRFRCRRQKTTYLEGDLVEVQTPSRERQQPICPHFGNCGGCSLQHAPYSVQLQLKEEIVADHFRRHHIVTDEALSDAWVGITASPRQYRYRTRIRLRINDRGRPGFHRGGTHDVVVVSGCAIAREELGAILGELAAAAALSQLLMTANELELLLSPDQGKAVILLHTRRQPRPNDIALATRTAQELPAAASLFFAPAGAALTGPYPPDAAGPGGLPQFTLPPILAGRALTLTYEPGGFCQVNQECNEALIAAACHWLCPTTSTTILDLFCGIGNFSIPLACGAGEVLGLDQQRSAIRSARRNQVAAGLVNCRFEQQDAAASARELAAQGRRFDTIILDPPRQGASLVIPSIPGLGAERILYVSCDPATLGRDIVLLQRHGYRLARLGLFDMFPQTHHVECLALLEKR